jgi:hypothetical protein
MCREQQLVSGRLVKRSYLLRDTRQLEADINEAFAEIVIKLGQAEVAHQVWQEI